MTYSILKRDRKWGKFKTAISIKSKLKPFLPSVGLRNKKSECLSTDMLDVKTHTSNDPF